MKRRQGVAVIGMGNWGTSLAAALAPAGLLAGRVRGSRLLPAAASAPRSPALEARVLWLAVPDDAIAAAAARLALRPGGLHGQVVVHSSGALGSGVLEAARRAGAGIASVHPMMSFPTRRRVPLAGVRFAVEAADPGLGRELSRLVRRLGGRPFALAGEKKALYHAAAMFGSPLLTALLSAGAGLLVEAGMPEREALSLLAPMAAATLENVRRRGAAAAFSGPLARGDAASIKLHRGALGAHPLEAGVYDALAGFAARRLPSRDRRAVMAALAGEAPAAAGGATRTRRRGDRASAARPLGPA